MYKVKKKRTPKKAVVLGVRFLRFRYDQPKATSSAIISANPMDKPIVANSGYLPL